MEDHLAQYDGPKNVSHELRFSSLYVHGRGIVVPCDKVGSVDIESLTQRMRDMYFAARAMVGREYSFPTVQLAK